LKDKTNRTVGEREVHVEGTSCSAVEEAAALVLAMMIAASSPPEPGSTSATPKGKAEPEPAPATTMLPPPPAPPARSGENEANFETGGSIRAAQREVGFQLLHGAAFAGAQVLRTAAFEVVATAALRAGAIRVLPSGFAVIESEARAALLAGPGALVRVRLAPQLFVEVLPELDFVFIRDSFEVRDGSQVPIHRPDLFAPRVSLGLGWQLR
jgi:hypothetical protein